MARRLSRLAIPLKLLVDRMTVVVLVAVSMVLLVVGKVDLKLADLVSSHAGDVAAPVLGLVAAPVDAARGLAQQLGDLLAVDRENARLRGEVDRLHAWQAEAIRLDVQNQALRRAAGMPPIERAIPVTTAAIVADTGGGFVQTRLLNAGADRGLAVGQAVVDGRGLVGRIVTVGRHSARVLLVTDLNAKIPVRIAGSGDRALLEGGNDRLPRLRFLPRDPRFALGERVITSGEGGLIPSGIPVGTITRVEGANVEVTPLVDWQRLDFVRILQAVPVEAPEASPPARTVGTIPAADTRVASDGGPRP